MYYICINVCIKGTRYTDPFNMNNDKNIIICSCKMFIISFTYYIIR